MRTRLRLSFVVVTAALCLSWHDRGHASPASAAREPLGYAVDAHGRPAYLARFRDGPRDVPEPHGPAKVRAEQLGIGDTQTARTLLTQPAPLALRRRLGRERPKQLLWPVVHGRFERGFGLTRRLRKDLPHNGVDIAAAAGTPVRAVARGLVVYSDTGLKGYGNCVMILHDGGVISLYAHNRSATVQAGQWVERGEQIALVGQTGYAWGPHLHFELRDHGQLRDPLRSFVGKDSDELLVRGERVSPDQPGQI